MKKNPDKDEKNGKVDHKDNWEAALYDFSLNNEKLEISYSIILIELSIF